MRRKALVIDQETINTLVNTSLEEIWFGDFRIPVSLATRIKRVEVGDRIYLLSHDADESSRLVVILLGKGGIFSGDVNSRQVFDRIIHIALHRFERTVSIPIQWRAYRDGARISIYAQPKSSGKGERLYFDTNPQGEQHIFVYAITRIQDFEEVTVDIEQFIHARECYLHALLEEAQDVSVGMDAQHNEAFGIVLTEPLGATLLGSGTLEEWYERKLTRQQLDFVNRSHKSPVRLKGAAGTGKTISMAIKCLRDTYKFENEKSNKRVAFITHSSTLAHDVVRSMFSMLDPKGVWQKLNSNTIWLGSLYELAQWLLGYNGKDLQPLSTDGLEGREFQRILISDAIGQCLKDAHFGDQLKRCSPEFSEGIHLQAKENDQLVFELMNEFACIIDAEGIRKGNGAAEKYVKSTREDWQMRLENKDDHEAVLDIHDKYCHELERSRTLSMDQMIADFNRYLLTHEWRQLRDKKGFDVIFVDELHYFNRAERMTFHNLFRTTAVENGAMPLFMAYDIKQSPGDALMVSKKKESIASMIRSVGAGKTELVELTEVFRSTPQIAEFLKDMDGSFPALNLVDEWGAYDATSKSDDGDVPVLKLYQDNVTLLTSVFREARREARRVGGRNVAVICVNESQFRSYLSAGRVAGMFISITARDEVKNLRRARNKFVFSMPEYVAGLQFQSVFLIHLDKTDYSRDQHSMGARRRFISQCYLGASRASNTLQLACSRERGGYADILQKPIDAGSLVLSRFFSFNLNEKWPYGGRFYNRDRPNQMTLRPLRVSRKSC